MAFVRDELLGSATLGPTLSLRAPARVQEETIAAATSRTRLSSPQPRP
ncbi:MAG: hypothetical protein H6Q05_3190 [Acidobacteria bacterium]|nr:hypothetical protein [Acidobacteriota bacterium]